MAIDLSCWLTYRNSYLRKLSRISWVSHASQLGASYQDSKDFKRKLLASLGQVLILYPEARVEQVRGGILLRPSPSNVRRQQEP